MREIGLNSSSSYEPSTFGTSVMKEGLTPLGLHHVHKSQQKPSTRHPLVLVKTF